MSAKPLSDIERARVFRLVLDKPQSEVSAVIEELIVSARDVLRIASAASIGVTGNQPRLERARAAIAKVTGSTP